MHKLLERQLRKCFGSAPPNVPGVSAFVAAVDTAYHASDEDRALLERSIALTSTELVERNRQLEQDLEAIRRLELELRQADKLRAVGQLAAGIAHEINTPIQFAGDSVHFLRGAFDELINLVKRAEELCRALDGAGDFSEALAAYKAIASDIEPDYLVQELPKAFEQTVEGLQRVTQIVMAMKEFGRADQREKSLMDVNRCIQSTLTVAHNELKYVADLEVELGELPPVPGFPGELSQVLLNLLVNAAHAVADRFGESERGRISVSTRHEPGWALISIADNGNGIPEEYRARIFEPFFTTKPLGRGTGQGLAISRSIVVEKHGGLLSFESRVGSGTTFHVKLPTESRASAGASANEREDLRA